MEYFNVNDVYYCKYAVVYILISETMGIKTKVYSKLNVKLINLHA